MSYSHDFADYTNNPNDLIGKPVYYTSRYSRSVSRIKRVTKTAFEVEEITGLFSLKSGYLKSSDVWNTSSCHLISEDRMTQYKLEFKQEKESEKIRSLITENINKLTYTQLTEIYKIIKPTP